jgi:methionyl-tRNA formyltransferase
MSIYLDAGEILAQAAVDIAPDETAGELEARLGPLGARIALATIDRLAAGPVSGLQQDKSQVTKAPKLTKENGLIDWSRSAEQVCNQIRAMQPWPTAYTFLHEKDHPASRLIICKAEPFPVRYDPAVPIGHAFVDRAFPGSLFVTAGLLCEEERSVVEISDLQPAGKRRMSAQDFLRGHPLAADARLGPEKP